MHYSFLNCAYNNDVNDDWQTGGCMDAIKKNLGYRFVLRNAIFPKSAIKAGMQLSFTLNIDNVGYASPYNARPAELIMRNKSTNKEFVFTIDTDVRKWYSGNNIINTKIITDNMMPAGDYDLFLFLPDASESLSQRPEYAIRFANENIWDAITGYNNLHSAIKIIN
ncbi:MAG TPA: DUF4832 domain-containing protein, partial [Parafilimonas sp.]|nr:DUF4832 domain-containing protein [Parafilimonas sp.]